MQVGGTWGFRTEGARRWLRPLYLGQMVMLTAEAKNCTEMNEVWGSRLRHEARVVQAWWSE